jgi:hypothetical protein
MKTEDKPFGNLSFSNYTMETEAERCLLAIQAALRVKGYSPSHPAMKKVLRLKRSMSRNKIRRYSFNLIPTKVALLEKPKKEGEPLNDMSELIVPVLEKATGLVFHSKESKVTSSGHFLVKFVLTGKVEQCRVEPDTNGSVNRVREEIAATMFNEHRDALSSFSLQPFRVRADEKGRVGLSVQCIYRGSDEKKVEKA